MNYKEFAKRNPEQLPANAGYIEYLALKFKSIAEYMNTKYSNRDSKLHFEGDNVNMLENIAMQMEILIQTIEGN